MSEYATPREAASVILLRERQTAADSQAASTMAPAANEVEVFLLRRHRKASFMSSAFVFPGGTADPGEDDPRITAARELFEEAGVLLTRQPVDDATRQQWRAELHEGSRSFGEILAARGVEINVDSLSYYAHWITPSVERKRFSARFYVATLPAGQTPSFDNRETVDEVWVTPQEALERAKELALPPPQVRTFGDLQSATSEGVSGVRADAARRAEHPFALMPRMYQLREGFALLLPWDPHYGEASGDSHPIPADHPLAVGPSRFVLEDATWKNISAPDLTNAD